MPKDVRGVLHEFKHGELHSGSKNGPKVTNRKQAIAIALSEQRQQGKAVAKKPASRKPASSRRYDSGRYVESATPVGFGSLSHRPKVLNNPKTLSGRRSAAHTKAYGD